MDLEIVRRMLSGLMKDSGKWDFDVKALAGPMIDRTSACAIVRVVLSR